MITQQLLTPKSIAVIGGSDDLSKPGGKVVKNLVDYGFKGDLHIVNPKADSVQGLPVFRTVDALPAIDLAILAVPASVCPAAAAALAERKKARAMIVFSAGFREQSVDGAALEKQLVDTANRYGVCLIGPNCIGVLTPHYAGVFTAPVPELSPDGVDFITGSGATAVFILDAAMQTGLRFASVYSVGNCAQTGVEDLLEHLDQSYCDGQSPRVKMLYLEHIDRPTKFLHHASSLIRKGARIVAVKAGSSEAGSRAASSHTGAMAGSDTAVDALFRKAGVIRCYSRNELITVAGVLMHPLPRGRNVAIVTHAGGPAVMLVDALSSHRINVPSLAGAKAQALQQQLYPGSSVANPIDFLATGTARQLRRILDACRDDFTQIDATAVIFGSPGLTRVFDVYSVIDDQMSRSDKPIYAIMPTVTNSREEIAAFIAQGHVCFPDEVLFGHALAKVVDAQSPVADSPDSPAGSPAPRLPDSDTIRAIVDAAENGYLPPVKVRQLLDAAGIPRAAEATAASSDEAVRAAENLGFPVAMKVVGPIHKSDVGGVALNISDAAAVVREYDRMMQIPGVVAVLLQPMLGGLPLFAGAKRESPFGHVVLCGLGGVFVEALHDVSAGLAPLAVAEAADMIRRLRGYKVIQGMRGQEPVDEMAFADVVARVAALCEAAPEIAEMDLNPLLGHATNVIAVDARICIQRDA